MMENIKRWILVMEIFMKHWLKIFFQLVGKEYSISKLYEQLKRISEIFLEQEKKFQ